MLNLQRLKLSLARSLRRRVCSASWILFKAASYAPCRAEPAPSLLPEDDPVEPLKVLRDTARQARQTQHRQRVGLAFLCLGFLLQGIAITRPPLNGDTRHPVVDPPASLIRAEGVRVEEG